MTAGRAIRTLLAGALWSAAVVIGGWAVAAFVSGGAGCVQGRSTGCGGPNEGALILGLAAAAALGVLGATIWKPKARRPEPRRPWDYPG